MILSGIDKPSPTNDMLPWAVLALFVLTGAALLGVFWLSGQVLSMRNRVDVLDDAATRPFAEDRADPDQTSSVSRFARLREGWAKLVERTAPTPEEPVRPTPYRRTDTVETGMPVVLEGVKLEAERQPTYREFTLTDGTVRRFEIKDSDSSDD